MSESLSIITEDLHAFLDEERDARAYRRALAVKFALQGYMYAAIGDMLHVSPSFVSKAKHAYETHGVSGLWMQYHGAQPYLSPDERQSVLQWYLPNN
jgi:putative transposase